VAGFEAKWDPLVLLAIVPVVLRTADPVHPEIVTCRAYNAAREPAGYAETPRADRLAARFGVSWSRFVTTVLTEEHPAAALAKSDYQRVRRRLTETQIVDALQTAAAWQGTEHISPAAYEEARLALDAIARRRHLHGRATEPLPAAAVIRTRWSFPEAAAAAGLTVTRREDRPTMPRHEVVRLFVASCGFVPRARHILKFTSHHRICLANKRDDPHAPAVDEARERALAAGEWFPADLGTVPADWRERLMQESEATREASQRYPAKHRGTYTVDELRAAVEFAFDQLEPGERLTQERWQYITKVHQLPQGGAAWRAAKAAGITWSAMVREVAAERAGAIRSPRAPARPADRRQTQ
jgi:hypothetical protein